MNFSVQCPDQVSVTRDVIPGLPVTFVVAYPTLAQQMAYTARYTAYHYSNDTAGDMAEDMLKDLDLVKGWSGVQDMEGKDIPFSQDTLRKIMVVSADFSRAVRDAVQSVYPTTTPRSKESSETV